MKNLYLCCNQLEHRWEVREKGTPYTVYTGSLDECKYYIRVNDK